MSNIDKKISIAGDVDIKSVVLISSKGVALDITPQVSTIEIFEDIFATFITGKLFIRDSQEITNFLPLVGEERLQIEIRTPSLSIEHSYIGEYAIYKMDDRTKIAEREIIYVLHFISKEAIRDLNKKISRAYSGKVSEIINTLIKSEYGLESDKNVNIEETSNSTKFIANWWRPTQCLQFATSTALNANNSPSYIFFENKYGLNFISLETLYTGTPLKQRFIWSQYTREIKNTGSADRDIDKDYQSVLEIDIPQNFNYMDRITSGMYGSELISYDILTKQYTHVGYLPSTDKDIKRLNEYPSWTETPPVTMKSMILYSSKYYNNFDGYGDVTNTRTVQKRTSLIANAEAHKLNIVVYGRTDYSAGQKIYLSIPKSTQIKSKDDPEDKILSGNYLISAIKHQIRRTGHQCTLELIKDSYIIDINKINN